MAFWMCLIYIYIWNLSIIQKTTPMPMPTSLKRRQNTNTLKTWPPTVTATGCWNDDPRQAGTILHDWTDVFVQLVNTRNHQPNIIHAVVCQSTCQLMVLVFLSSSTFLPHQHLSSKADSNYILNIDKWHDISWTSPDVWLSNVIKTTRLCLKHLETHDANQSKQTSQA